MIKITLQREEFFPLVTSFVKSKNGNLTIRCEDDRFFLVIRGSEASCPAKYDTPFESLVSKENLIKLVSINKQTPTLLKELTLSLDPERKRISGPGLAFNARKLNFL